MVATISEEEYCGVLSEEDEEDKSTIEEEYSSWDDNIVS
jgi:hypothetical protein